MSKIIINALSICIIFLLINTSLSAQNKDFDKFLNGFNQTKLPYQIAPDTTRKFKKSRAITATEAQTFLVNVYNVNGSKPEYYWALIEPSEPYKTEDGRWVVNKTDAYKVDLLKRTDAYVLFVVCIRFVEKGLDNMSGEQYLLYSFKPNGTPISVLPIAQRVQFDLHYNQVSSTIDQDGNLNSIVEVFAPSGNEKDTEKYFIPEDGDIEKVSDY